MPKAATARNKAMAAFSNLSQRCLSGARCSATMGTITEAASRRRAQWGNTFTRPGSRVDEYTSMAISTMGHRGSSFDDCSSWLIAGLLRIIAGAQNRKRGSFIPQFATGDGLHRHYLRFCTKVSPVALIFFMMFDSISINL